MPTYVYIKIGVKIGANILYSELRIWQLLLFFVLFLFVLTLDIQNVMSVFKDSIRGLTQHILIKSWSVVLFDDRGGP